MNLVPDPAALGFDRPGLARIESRMREYVDRGALPGFRLIVTRKGQVALSVNAGKRDLEASLPMEADTLFRLYSMTKVVTAVAVMQLVEQGKVAVADPLAKFIPEFAGTRVWGGFPQRQAGVEQPSVTIQHLLTHTSGLTYGFLHANPVDAMYREAGFDWGTPPALELETCVKAWAGLPLLFPPGVAWNYSVGFDVLGRVLEVASGTKLPDLMRDQIFAPLGMVDSGFHAHVEAQCRLAALYSVGVGAHQAPRRELALEPYALSAPVCPSGGGGLLSTAGDFQRFLLMLMNRGELDGRRILAASSVDRMFSNQLPGGVDLSSIGIPVSPTTDFAGLGFGFGLSIVLDPSQVSAPCRRGEVSADGAASTFFWMDPQQEVTVLFLAQLLPSSCLPLRSELRQLVWEAVLPC